MEAGASVHVRPRAAEEFHSPSEFLEDDDAGRREGHDGVEFRAELAREERVLHIDRNVGVVDWMAR